MLPKSQSPSRDTLRRLRDHLDHPRESLECEYKTWLDLNQEEDRADLAQAALAMANHGGGVIVIGYQEANGKWQPSVSRPASLASYGQDPINNIVHAYADPPFHCEVHFVAATTTTEEHPVIVVPGGHRVPIRAKKDGPDDRHVQQNAYYIRRPRPRSERPKSGREWDELIGRCLRAARSDLLDDFRAILEGPRAHPAEAESSPASPKEALTAWAAESRTRVEALAADLMERTDRRPYANGVWSVAYLVDGTFDRPNLAALVEIIRGVKGHESGWPPWIVLNRDDRRPYPIDGLVECWLGGGQRSLGMADFWRVSPFGKLYLLRNHQEDTGMTEKPKTILDLVLPVWRAGECLLHAARFAAAVGVPSADVHMSCSWTGLRGRVLKTLASPHRILFERYASMEDVITTQVSTRASDIDIQLPELTRSLTESLYEAFDFFTPPPEMCREELARMRGRTSLENQGQSPT